MNTIAVPLPRHPHQPRAALARLFRAVVRMLDRPRPEHLDDAALRDLGISRSELGSFDAEAHGLVATTRLRVFDSLHRGM